MIAFVVAVIQGSGTTRHSRIAFAVAVAIAVAIAIAHQSYICLTNNSALDLALALLAS